MGNVCSWAEDERKTEAAPSDKLLPIPKDTQREVTSMNYL